MRDADDLLKAALLDESTEDLYEHAPCGYVSLLGDGLIGRANATFCSWIGIPREVLVDRVRFLDLLTVGGRIYYETHFQPLLRMQGAVREIAFDLVRPNGERFPVLVNASQRRYDEAGAITRVTIFDATDRRRYERELLAARNRAEEAAQARADLIAMISHDVRAPLSAMLTAIALLEKSSPTPRQQRYLRILQSSAAHALALVNNVLDLSRLDSGRAALREREFVVRALIEEVTAAARLAAVKKTDLQITIHVDDDVPERLVGDGPKLGQVLANLMMNAVKFTAHGFVNLAVGVREATAEYVSLEVVVSDSGIGIPTDRLPHIFEEFTQASDEIAEQYGGSGLGLAITRRLLALYESELNVTSTVGQGSTFSFVVPLKRVPA